MPTREKDSNRCEGFYLWFDGSCQPKGSGCSSIGLSETREGGVSELFKIASPLVCGTTSNESEYFGLIRGLRMLLRHVGVSRSHQVPLVVFSDSELVLNQIQGVYQCRNSHLRLLCTTAKGLLESFTNVSFKHVNREMNEEADLLAKNVVNEKSVDIKTLTEFYPNRAFALCATVEGKSVKRVAVTNNIWAATLERLCFIDAAFLVECYGKDALRHMKDPYPLNIVSSSERMNVLGIYSDDITVKFSLRSGGLSKAIKLTNVVVVHRFAVPLHISLETWEPELMQTMQDAKIEKNAKVFGETYSTHPFWHSENHYLGSAYGF